MKRFEGFRLVVVIPWPLEASVGGPTLQFSGRSPQTLAPLLNGKDSLSMDLEGIKPSLYTFSAIWYASEMSFVTRLEVQEVNSMKIPTIFSFPGGNIDYVRKDWGHFYQITAVACYHLSDIISGGGVMKSFAGFLHVIVVRWLCECSWRSSSGISGSPMGTLEAVFDHHNVHHHCIERLSNNNCRYVQAFGMLLV